jgi:hypothetical protein
MGNRCFSEYIFLSLSPLAPTHCRCRGLLLHLLTLGDTNTHLLNTTSVNEESARRKHLYLTTHTTFTTETVIPSAGFEAAFPTIDRTPTHAFDAAATGIG